MARMGRDFGEQLSLVETAIQANDRQKARMVDKIESGIGGAGSLQGKTVAILGLAFKPNTNDMRDAPAVFIIDNLLKEGAKV
jgi:UDPglucose 6-dehydrogenase